MFFDYRDMVKEAVESGQESTRSCLLGSHDNDSASASGMTIDTTAYTAATPSSFGHWPMPLRSQTSPVPRTFSCKRVRLSHFVTTWLPYKESPRPKSSINLAGKNTFSDAFGNVLGTANTTNIYRLDDDLIGEAVFEALVEREAISQYRSGSGDYIKGLLNIDDYRDGMIVSGELEPDGNLRWRINHGTENKGGWLDLVRTIFSLSRLDALATLTKIVNMDIKRLQSLSSDRHPIDLNGRLRSDEDVPKMLHLSRLPAGSACVELVDKAYIYGNVGQIIGAILSYRLDGKDFCLPATVGKKLLCMGKYKPIAHFLNQHLMDQHPGATILFCQDMRTALAVQMLFNQMRENNPDAEIIVTAHLGDDLSVLPWNYIYGHEVVFVPAPTKQCMAMLNLYAAQIKGAGARDFRIYPGFLLHSLPACGLKDHVEGVTEAEAKLLRSAIVLEEVECPIHRARKMIEKSISYKEYKNWGERLGIFKGPIKINTLPSEAQILVLPPADPALTPAPAHDLAHVTLCHVMRIGNYVVILGAKGAGKTQVALSTCRSIIKGDNMWPLFRGTGITCWQRRLH